MLDAPVVKSKVSLTCQRMADLEQHPNSLNFAGNRANSSNCTRGRHDFPWLQAAGSFDCMAWCAVYCSVELVKPITGEAYSRIDRLVKCSQVREHMRTSKEALQKLRPIAALVAEAVNKSTSDHEEEEVEEERVCIVCLDQPSSVTFHPCSHSVTCAQLVMKAEQALCPLCRAPIISL